MSAIKGSSGAAHPFLSLVDTHETYGRHILEDFLKNYIHTDIKLAYDIGVGGVMI